MTQSLLRRFTFPAIAALAFAGSASAATSVLDSASGRTCFDAARTGATKAGLAACDAALDSASLSGRDLAATYANRAVLYLDDQQGEAALADAETALRIAPQQKDASINKAGALLMLGRYEEARATLDGVLPELTGTALERGLYNRALAQEALGNVNGAYHDYLRAASLNPASAATVELARFQVK